MQIAQPGVEKSRPRFAKLLVSQNPFYVISSACAIHGSSYWFRSSGDSGPWALMALVGGFILLLAIIGFCVVRLGQLWDDARSIFVMLFLLFIELALSFDDAFVNDWREGTLLFFCGWLFAVVVFEFLFQTLRIKLRAFYRVPFHFMLALLFLYPVTMVWSIQNSQQRLIQWQLFGFNIAVSTCVLLLVPAIRKGTSYCQLNGTPWRWPLFPWIPFGVIIGALCIRSYAMCASLDPAIAQSVSIARQLQSIFSWYFLSPIVLAIAVLLLELGLSTRNRTLRTTALLAPALACLLALPVGGQSSLQSAFIAEVTGTFAAPLLLMLSATTVFYGLAAWRGIRAAEWWLTLVALGIAFASNDTTARFPESLPRAWPLSLIAMFHILLGTKRRSIQQMLVGVSFAIVPLHRCLVMVIGVKYGVAVEFHLGLLLWLVLAVRFRQQALLHLLAGTFAGVAVITVFPPHDIVREFSYEFRYAYVASLILLTSALFYFTRVWAFVCSSLAGILSFGVVAARQIWLLIRHIDGWQGLAFYGAGFFWLLVAILISIWKSRRGPDQPEADSHSSPAT